MATHDYVLANASGAAFRADLNNALAAIVSNNSNATSPATTYAYQWWADTNTGQLKLRNAANDAWIVIQELDGTMLMEDGTAASPGLSFAADLDTGIFRPAANQFAIATNGIERIEIGTSEIVINDGGEDIDFRVEGDTQANLFFVDAGNERVGIGASAPGTFVEIDSTAPYVTIKNSTEEDTAGGRESKIVFEGEQSGGEITSLAEIEVSHEGTADDEKGQIILKVNSGAEGASPSEAVRVASSGRLLVGTSAARSFISSALNPQFQIEGTDDNSSIFSITRNSNNSGTPRLIFGKSRGTANGAVTVVSSGDVLGSLLFDGADGTDTATAAAIDCAVDGTPGSNDMPGRLVFSTTADGAASPTEAMRIDSSGRLLVGTSSGSGEPIAAFQGRATDASDGAMIALTRTGATPSGTIGIIQFATGSDYGKHFATIISASDGTVSSSSTPGHLRFSTTADNATSSTERVRIDKNGSTRVTAKAGIDCFYATTPTGAGTSVTVMRGGHSATEGSPGTGTDSIFVFANGNIQNTNDSYGQISDVKLKENIVDAGSQWDDFKAVRFRKYNFKKETGHETHTQLGVIAQELELTSPGLVYETADQDKDGNDLGTTTKAVKSSILTNKALVALQEAMARIETLETKVAALEAG